MRDCRDLSALLGDLFCAAAYPGVYVWETLPFQRGSLYAREERVRIDMRRLRPRMTEAVVSALATGPTADRSFWASLTKPQ